MVSFPLIIFILIVTAVLIAIFLALFQFLKAQIKTDIKESQEQFLQLSRQQFESEQNKAAIALETRKEAVDGSIKGLKEQLDKYQQLLRELEQDRERKFSYLEAQLKNASQATVNLQDTTNRLNNILGNVKLRGQWGERMAEDIIRYAGLVEGVNYQKQTQQDTVTTKPDYTFFLPDEHKVNMDVKFPLDNYLRMMNATTDDEKERFAKDFIRNLKDRIKEIQNRDYINPAEKTLDFVLLFIPNEQVYGLIQEKMPGVMDEALKQKVVLCSPFTLYAMLSVIRQSFENFRYEKDIKKIVALMDQFAKYFEKFKGNFEKIGKSIDGLEATYEDIKTKDFKRLDTKMRHIEDYKKGQGIALNATDPILIDADDESADDEKTLS